MFDKESSEFGEQMGMGDNNFVKKKSLLRTFDIPVEHLDFGYVRKCKDVKYLEKLLLILRSGEEGYYSELEETVKAKIGSLDPNNVQLREEFPVVRSENMRKDEREHIVNDIEEWLGIIKGKDESSQSIIFNEDNDNKSTAKMFDDEKIPIRGAVETPQGFLRPPNPCRIKSWEYDKWDKYDVDHELTKMDVTDMQVAEWEKVHKPRIAKEEKETVAKLMKNEEDSHQVDLLDVAAPSFIEEVIGNDNVRQSTGAKNIAQAPKPQRKIRVQIEDVNVPFKF